MSSLQARSVSRPPIAIVNHAARLELLEYYLIHHEDLARCAHATLEWLARHAGVRRSVCLAVDSESNMLVGIAGYGVRNEDVGPFSWPMTDSEDTLVAALSAAEPLVFRPSRANGHPGRVLPSTPLGHATFTAIPLRGVRETEEGSLGLLLLRQPAGS